MYLFCLVMLALEEKKIIIPRRDMGAGGREWLWFTREAMMTRQYRTKAALVGLVMIDCVLLWTCMQYDPMCGNMYVSRFSVTNVWAPYTYVH